MKRLPHMTALLAALLLPAAAHAGGTGGQAEAAGTGPSISMAVPDDQSLSLPEGGAQAGPPSGFTPEGLDADVVIERAIIRNDESYKDIILIWT